MIQKDRPEDVIIQTETAERVRKMKLHIRYDGKSQTMNAEELGIQPDTGDMAIKEILSGVSQLPPDTFRNLVVDRHPDGIIVRPPAVFG